MILEVVTFLTSQVNSYEQSEFQAEGRAKHLRREEVAVFYEQTEGQCDWSVGSQS